MGNRLHRPKTISKITREWAELLLDKKKVSKITKIGAVVLSFAFIVSFIPYVWSNINTPSTANQPGQDQAQAVKTINSLVQNATKNPKSAEAWEKLGNAYSDYGKTYSDPSDPTAFQKAIDSYKKALDIDPKNMNARVDMAIQYFRLGQIETATAEAQKAIQINPSFAPAYYNLAVFLMSQGKIDDAIAAYENYIKADPKGEMVDEAKKQIETLKASENATSTPNKTSSGK